MIKRLKIAKASLIFLIALFVFVNPSISFSQEHDDHEEERLHTNYIGELAVGQNSAELQKQLDENRKEQERVRQLLEETRSKKVTLQNEITYQDNQIKLTTLKIDETEKEIVSLTGQINRLEGVLVDLSDIFSERAVETYKLKRTGDSLVALLTSNSVSEFISQFQYLQRVQENDRDLLLEMQSAQTNYEHERTKVEELQEKLEGQKSTLDAQKNQKQNLLKVTQQDEKKYQEMLANLKANEAAIEKAISSLIARIVAGIATGTQVSKGQAIGVQGNTGNVYPRPSGSCPNCGSHLHYMVFPCDVTKSGTNCHTNPRPYLDDGQYAKPLEYKYISQEYGSTSFAQSGAAGYGFHSGLDMVGNHGTPIFSVADGTVYYGVDSAGGKYALVKHKDDFWTGYWHLQ